MTCGASATLLPTTCAGPFAFAPALEPFFVVVVPLVGAGLAFFAAFLGSTTLGASGLASGVLFVGAGVTACGTVVVEVPECEEPAVLPSSVASCGTPAALGVGAGGGGVEPPSVAVWSVPAVSAPEAPLASPARPAAVSPPPASAESAARQTRQRWLEGAMRRVQSSSGGPIEIGQRRRLAIAARADLR